MGSDSRGNKGKQEVVVRLLKKNKVGLRALLSRLGALQMQIFSDLGCGFAFALTLAGVVSQAQAQSTEIVAPVAGGHRISLIQIRIDRPHPWLPDPALLLDSTAMLARRDGLLGAPAPDEPSIALRLSELAGLDQPLFDDTAFQALSQAVFERMRQLGFVGVWVMPDTAEFRVEDGRVVDLRPEGTTSMTLIVTVGRVTEVRSVGLGERLDPEKTVNNPVHARIVRNSPVRPIVEGEGAQADLVRRDLIDAYTHRLSRHPGRRVDVAVAAAEDEAGGVLLDYLITENRPWLFFAQASTTGSAGTSRWREHFGFIHNDLTNADDILTLGYQTANFKDIHTAYGSYERPVWSDRLRARIGGSWYEYVSSQFGLADEEFAGDGWDASLELAWNVAQSGAWFLDVVGGLRYQHVSATNNLALIEGEDDFLKPGVGLRLQRTREIDRTFAHLGLEWNLPGVVTDGDDLDALGRTDAVDDWVLLRGEASHSFYLDPLLRDTAERKAGLVNELALSVRGQYAFNSRLIPGETFVAGGLYTVRGYPESVVSGDNGVIASAEYRIHLTQALEPDVTPGSMFGEAFRFRPQYQYGPTDWDFQIKAFVDAGAVSSVNRQSFEVDSTLVGVGLGAELSFTRRFNVRVDWGVALVDLEDATGGRTVDAGRNELSLVITGVY